ncbi:MAG TPA: biliverdin-producing heme oxygenase [Leptospiraceae bacterium]|nr:biliverdin-producing heme oxygenase [Leptospiraceae bacterium]HMW03454.1 biliverdin-producing heme oxygenase [Leptospiraceae bacterium]HMX31587.1 biliverdin-producing heme oxygenase [Leptospiraceae bacterium]HMY29626.1 biliverdin-producing heme oxygenase [Leptospiraceae bacterium]HMZ62884.1 biliverdin-producing heme oxygenase [Leptospiraceae bacterium]
MNSIHLLLKENTDDLHTRLEQVGFVNKIMNQTLTLQDYKKLIRANYAFHDSVERNLRGIMELADLDIIWKMPFLEKDRFAVGDFIIDKIENPFEPENFFEALGSLYVLEGATLGGKTIRRQLQNLPVNMHYYGCYGEDGGFHWRRFLDILKRNVDTEEKANFALKGAKETFLFGIRCFEKICQL